MAEQVKASFEYAINLMSMSTDQQLRQEFFEAERQYSLWQAIVSHKRIIFHSTVAFSVGICNAHHVKAEQNKTNGLSRNVLWL
jgi:hypothetical protein